MKWPGFWDSALRPRMAIARASEASGIPWVTWSLFVFVAIAGSVIFGARLARDMSLEITAGALLFALSAGLSWPVLMFGLRAVTGLRLPVIVHACLVAMAYGEVVLVSGALVGPPLIWFHAATVACSNMVMVTVLAVQLNSLGVPPLKTVFAWFAFLNAVGAVLFFLSGLALGVVTL